MVAVEQRLEHRIGAADAVHVDRQVTPPGRQIRNERRAGEDLGDIVEGETQARLVRDRRQVQAGIG
jgi:hypothetical protein